MDLCTTRANIKVQSCGSQTTYESVRIALSRGFFTNVARLTREGHYITLDSRQKVSIKFRTITYGVGATLKFSLRNYPTFALNSYI